MSLKRLIGRSFWLLAWGAWIWCGFGLYRELPCASFRQLCRLNLEYGSVVLGFLHGDDLIVVSKFADARPTMMLLDPRTGRVVNECPGATDRRSSLSMRHGVLVGLPFAEWPLDGSTTSTERPKKSLNLRTGEWTDLKIRSSRVFDFHPDHPWVALSLNEDETKAPHVAIVDFQTGDRVAEIKGDVPPPGSTDLVHECGFLGGDEILLVIEHRPSPKSRDPRQRFERWKFNGQRAAAPSELKRTYFRFGPVTRSGRIRAIGSFERGMDVDVLDVRTGAVAETSSFERPMARTGRTTRTEVPPLLERLGRTFLAHNGVLHHLESNEVVWRPNEEFETVHIHELIRNSTEPASVFVVSETWKTALPKWPSFLPQQTLAVRRMENGFVWFRTRGILHQFKQISDDGRFGVAGIPNDRGNVETGVYELPPPIDWTLFFICQGILAIPLILIWLIARRWASRLARSNVQ